ncbi:MAG: hypothetical protein AAFY84_05890 [Pseudomonadota bacterium]
MRDLQEFYRSRPNLRDGFGDDFVNQADNVPATQRGIAEAISALTGVGIAALMPKLSQFLDQIQSEISDTDK